MLSILRLRPPLAIRWGDLGQPLLVRKLGSLGKEDWQSQIIGYQTHDGKTGKEARPGVPSRAMSG